MSEIFHLRGRLFPFDEEITDLWIVNGHITYSEPNSYQKFNDEPVYILPGLVDSHVHLSFDYSKFGTQEWYSSAGKPDLIKANREAHLKSGVLLLRDIGSSGPNTLKLTRDDGLPPVISAGNFLAPPGGFYEVINYVTPEELPLVAKHQLEQGYDWVKIIGNWAKTDPQTGKMIPFENYPHEAVFETVKLVHQMGGKIAMHAQNQDSISTAIEAGVDSLEHGFGFGAISKAQLDIVADKGILWTPTLSPILSILQTTTNERERSFIINNLPKVAELIAYGQEQGISILAGTDTIAAGNINFEIQGLAKYGLTPLEALYTATLTPRKVFNEPIFEESAPADLLLYNYNPIEALDKVTNPEKIIFGGKEIKHH